MASANRPMQVLLMDGPFAGKTYKCSGVVLELPFKDGIFAPLNIARYEYSDYDIKNNWATMTCAWIREF